MNAVEKADRILKDVVFILVAGAIIVFAVNYWGVHYENW